MSLVKKLLFNSPKWIKDPILRRKIKIDEEKLNGVSFKIADSVDELAAAFSLVHDVYVKEGYMDPDPSGMRVTKYNTLPYTTTFVGKENGDVVLTMSLVPDSAYGLPMDVEYKEEVDALREQGRYVAEVGSLASHPEFRNSNQNIPMHGNKIMHSYARKHLGVDDLVIAINPKHKWLYESILLFEQIGGEKSYDFVKGAPAIAMRLDLRTAKERYHDVYDGNSLERDLHNFFFEKYSDPIHLPLDRRAVSMKDLGLSDFIAEHYVGGK